MTTPVVPADISLRRALDPAPSAIERGPTARLHWRHGLGVDKALRTEVLDPTLSAEWSAVLAETHARLLDPAGVRDLASPSPVGAAVGAALENDPSWPGLVAAASLHPLVARETVAALAPLVRSAVTQAGAAKVDSRHTLQDLQAARKRLEEARQHADEASDDRAEALQEAVDAGEAVERASAKHQQAAAAADGVEPAMASKTGAVAALLATAQKAVGALQAVMSSGLGHALGATDAAAVPDDVVELLTPEVVQMLKCVGALRASVREGRTTRHLSGREGMLGPDVGGLDRVADLMPMARAALAGHLGDEMCDLALLRLVQNRADVVEKGGGRANEGDVGLVLDQSASMRGARAMWANAVAIAILLEAQLQGRHAVLVTFGEAVIGTAIVDGPTGLRQALKLCCAASDSNGTNVPVALDAVLKGLKGLRRGGVGADCVLATDGEWNATDADRWPTGHAAPKLHAVFLGGAAPKGTRLDHAWSVDVADGAADVAVAITKTFV
jgi:hypothetical protein